MDVGFEFLLIVVKIKDRLWGRDYRWERMKRWGVCELDIVGRLDSYTRHACISLVPSSHIHVILMDGMGTTITTFPCDSARQYTFSIPPFTLKHLHVSPLQPFDEHHIFLLFIPCMQIWLLCSCRCTRLSPYIHIFCSFNCLTRWMTPEDSHVSYAFEYH